MTDTNSRKIFCFLGLPASGKGTQVQILAKAENAQVLGVGNLIREEIENADLSDPFYADIKERYDKGIPQSDEVILDIIKKHLSLHKEKNIIFDNFPFSTRQAEAFYEICEELKSDPLLIVVKISPDSAINRIVHRKVCSSCDAVYADREASICEKCGGALISRSDDTVEVVENRIKFYLPRIEEVKSIFAQHDGVLEVDGEGSVEEVSKLIADGINGLK